MPNIKSAKKRVLVEKRNAMRNKSAKSEIKTVIKKFEAALVDGKKDDAAKLYKDVTSILDSAVLKGIVHKNQAARKKSNLAKKLNTMA